ncbi:OTU domain-containing protein [Canna indica]|uniref:ubiquitinyl hydrolase 1 n=1 Tax=Canna indica TaxID=4628 RepID=A0AAQ3JXV5_9LILI|nr:OTU domain-containing protein [Canna indica]
MLMATYEQDSEAYRWEYGLFNGDLFSNPPNSGGISEQEPRYYDNIYIGEDPSGPERVDEEHTQASDFTEDLFGPYARGYSLEIEDGHEARMQPSSSSSSPGENSYEREYLLDAANEFSMIDNEVGRRLNQMVPVRHVPKINGDIPSIDEATSDHERLTERLRLYDLVERKVEGDGNCQFRALSDQLYGTPEHHKSVRQQVTNQLRSHPEIYEGYVPMAYDDYLKRMSKSGEWGDHVTLQAASDSYGVKIFVITSFKDTCYIEILPIVQKPKREITFHISNKSWQTIRFHLGGMLLLLLHTVRTMTLFQSDIIFSFSDTTEL